MIVFDLLGTVDWTSFFFFSGHVFSTYSVRVSNTAWFLLLLFGTKNGNRFRDIVIWKKQKIYALNIRDKYSRIHHSQNSSTVLNRFVLWLLSDCVVDKLNKFHLTLNVTETLVRKYRHHITLNILQLYVTCEMRLVGELVVVGLSFKALTN